MSIGFVSAKGSRYYTELARDDYWTEGGERPGQWFENDAARRLGLEGRVDKAAIERLFDGYHHQTGEQLAQNHGKPNRCAAYDLTLSVPKDISTMLAVASYEDRKRIEAAIERATDKTLKFVNDHAGWTRKGVGGLERERVELLIAKYQHITSRDGTPQWHWHCLVVNAARRADGTFATVDGKEFPAVKKAAGGYFRTQLVQELAIPVERDPRAKFSFRVPGVPEALSDHWSQGTKRIARSLPSGG